MALLVDDYDKAIRWFTTMLPFDLVEDTQLDEEGKRWVVIRPQGAMESGLLLACASTAEQKARIGDQSGGRVFLFLRTCAFDSDYARMVDNGVELVEQPRLEPYGKVVVFRDYLGNKWDLIEQKH